MCGIAGIVGQSTPNKEKIIREMVERIRHRGPDGDGFYDGEKASIGMRRLSIIDLSTGDQPIWNETKDIGIVFNGEIYNYKILREELLQQNHILKTHSDTETLVHLYEQHGPEMLLKLRGMFTFAIYDKRKEELFVARDYFGIKPLYYFFDDWKLKAFGSEIKSILLHPDFKPELNEKAIFNYLSYQYNPFKETFFRRIHKLLPGHYLRIDLNDQSIKEEKYWGYQFREKNIDEEKLKREVREGIEDSVRAHMIADVPVGAFLSGGIDSAVIVAMMSKVRKETGDNLKTFTIGFNEVSEQSEAKVMADLLGTEHTEISVNSEEYFREMPKIVWHFDEPVADPSAVALYFLAREARRHVKVVLSGEGSDELFGGYNIYREPFALAYAKWLPKSLIRFFANLPFDFYGRNYLQRVLLPIRERYIGNAYVFHPAEIEKLWKSNPNEKFNLNPLYDQVKTQTDSAKMQFIDIHTWLPGDILAKADKMTMANSLELRVPFLDVEIAKISGRIPEELKYKNGKTKYILREAFEGILPKATADRKKLGFPTPIRAWLKDPKKAEVILKTITDNEYISAKFSLKYIKELSENHLNRKEDNARKLYLLYMLALWYNVFIKNDAH
ncbi:MAG TPA: asparagine synthase (glutamine-hydrolyzing) [Candidatus Paceibacterota bacterium]|nr:asparagine synthase (glutamine-hydrolyzing) [Candidatus Paceibacterota bacterium]